MKKKDSIGFVLYEPEAIRGPYSHENKAENANKRKPVKKKPIKRKQSKGV